MFVSHLPEFLSRLDFSAAAQALGHAAVAAVQEEMLTGFGQPIRRTGALMQDVSCTTDDCRVTIGNTLPYAISVHEGTCRTPGRPYLTNGLLNHAELLRQAVVEALRQQETGCSASFHI